MIFFIVNEIDISSICDNNHPDADFHPITAYLFPLNIFFFCSGFHVIICVQLSYEFFIFFHISSEGTLLIWFYFNWIDDRSQSYPRHKARISHFRTAQRLSCIDLMLHFSCSTLFGWWEKMRIARTLLQDRWHGNSIGRLHTTRIEARSSSPTYQIRITMTYLSSYSTSRRRILWSLICRTRFIAQMCSDHGHFCPCLEFWCKWRKNIYCEDQQTFVS